MSSTQLSDAQLEELKQKLQEEGVVKCPNGECSETFKSIWGLRFHLNKNVCNSPAHLKCGICKRDFSTLTELEQHTVTCNKGEIVEFNSPSNEVISKSSNVAEVAEQNQGETKKSSEKQAGVVQKVQLSQSEGNILTVEISDSNPDDVSGDVKQNISDQAKNTNRKTIDNNPKIRDTDIQTQKSKTCEDSKIMSSTELSIIEKQKNKDLKTTLGEDKIAETEINVNKSGDNFKSPLAISKQISSEQQNRPPKRKRGRPKQASTPIGEQVSSEQQNVPPKRKRGRPKQASTPIGEQVSSEQQNVPPKRKRGRPKQVGTPEVKLVEKKSKFETPESEKHSPLRKSSRSTGKKVNYAQLNQSDDKEDDDDNEDDDDDDNDDHDDCSGKDESRINENQDSSVATATPTPNSETPKRRVGRPRKNTSVGKPTSVAIPNSDTPKRKVGRPKKNSTVTNTNRSDDNQAKESKQELTDDSKIEESNAKDDVEDVKPPPKKRGRKKRVETEEESLKRRARNGQLLPCANNCGKKLGSYAGYKMHMKICGKEERETFKCEICGKVYQSEPGLKYHMKARHEEKKIVEEEVAVEDTSNDTIDNGGGETPRRVRKAAARAIEKVHNLTDYKKVIDRAMPPTQKRSEVLDGYIIKERDHLVSFAIVRKWKEEIKAKGQITCPNKNCHEEFKSPHILQTHFLQCGFMDAPYKCKECGKDFLTIPGARYHVESVHVNKNEYDEDANSDDNYSYDESDDESDDDDDENDDDDTVSISSRQSGRSIRKHHPRKKRGEKKLSITVGHLNDTFRTHSKWRRKHLPQEDLFQEYLPRIPHWKRVQVQNISEYTPVSSSSPYFVISRPDEKTTDKIDDIQLPLFTGLDKNDSGNYGDCIFYAGGPVWGLAWCPTFDSDRNANQYIAVSAHRSYQSVHHPNICQKEKGTIQLWNVGSLTDRSSRSGCTPTLSLCIAHKFGPIFQLIWCPFGAWQPPDTKTNDNCLPRLGLLAVVCGDGVVRILSIPHPESLLSKLPPYRNKTNNVEDKEYFKVMVHATCEMELLPCPLNVDYNGERGMALSIDWSQLSPFHHVAAGFSDGSVAIWNLSSQSSLLTRKTQENHTRFAPFVLLNAHTSIVRGVALCPSSQDFIVTGGEERSYKVWDLKSPSLPLLVLRKGYPSELQWPLHCDGFLYCEHDIAINNPPSLRHCNVALVDVKRILVLHSSGIWSFSYNQWLGVAASSDIAGDVYISKMPTRTDTANWPLYKTYLESLTVNTEKQGNEDSESKEHQLKQTSISLDEARSISRLVYKDKNPLQFQFTVPFNKMDLKESPSAWPLNSSTLPSVHKVRWNPNKQAMLWIASGGASGLVRLHHVKELKSHSSQDNGSPTVPSPL